MMKKLKEIVSTGGLSKMIKFMNNEELKICKNLEKVWGIGQYKAK